METLIALIIIFVAVLSTPLSLKKLIDHANRRQKEALLQNPEQPRDSEPSRDSESSQNPEPPQDPDLLQNPEQPQDPTDEL